MTEGVGVTDVGSNDAYLVGLAQDGYIDAYEELVRRHGPLAYRTALRILGNHEDAQDVAQEAFLAAWRSLDRFRGQASFTTWLYQIVTRQCLTRLRRGRWSATPEPVDAPDPAAEPAAVIETKHSNATVTRAIEQLPPAQRVAVVLHHIEGLSYAEVAKVTHSTVPAIRSHLFRARRTLARTLQEWR